MTSRPPADQRDRFREVAATRSEPAAPARSKEPTAETGLLVLAPLRIEARALQPALSGARVLRSGMGPKAAARSARLARSDPARALAVAGFCGALERSLAPGDLVVATEVLGPNGIRRACPSASLLAADLARAGLVVHAGPILSVEHPVTGRERDRLRNQGAVAVDMESAWLAESAGHRPFAVVRAVMDTPERELFKVLATATGGFRAFRSLRRAGPSLRRWAAAVGPRRVLLAGPRSFCAGVERAIEIVERALDRFGAPVYVRKQIVHNVHVVRDLEQRGAVFVETIDEVPRGAHAVFSAHGVSPEVREKARRRDLQVIDATCPLVTKVHTEARRFAKAGYTIFLIGHDGHEEVEGTTGEAPDVIRLVDGERGLGGLAPSDVPDPDKVAYLTQTTLAVDEVNEVVRHLKERFPSLAGPGSDDICYATQNRQDAVKALAAECDLLLVIGSDNSSNSKRLVEVAAREGCRARLVDDESGIDLAWLEGVGVVGLTAGASAPEILVERVVHALEGLGPIEVALRDVVRESMRFTLPVELRRPGDPEYRDVDEDEVE